MINNDLLFQIINIEQVCLIYSEKGQDEKTGNYILIIHIQIEVKPHGKYHKHCNYESNHYRIEKFHVHTNQLANVLIIVNCKSKN